MRRSISCLLASILFLTTSFAQAENPRVRMETNLGNIEIELFEKLAPKTVANFLDLVENDFYNDLIFHRVIANFMIQGGGYTEKMKYRDAPRTVPNESFNGVKNTRGTIAMARTNDPDSADSQFFINVRDNPRLDATLGNPGYAVFGKVSAGMEVVEQIELVSTHLFQGHSAVPQDAVIIKQVERL